LVASTTLWDFGRTLNSVRTASHLSDAQKAETELTQNNADIQAARLYFECARYQSQFEAWSFVVSQAQLVSKEVERFVRTGQRSVVERYLSRSQLEEAQTAQTDSRENIRLSRQRLQILTRMPLDELRCPTLHEIPIAPPTPPVGTNPLVLRASENALAAKSQVDRARDDFFPQVKAFAGVGALENTRVVPKEDYAVGVGLQIPLFDGFETLNSVESAESNEQAKQDLVAAAHDEIELTNARYAQLIDSDQVRLVNLNSELKLADQAFNVAKDRYFSLQGTLVDLREALRNLMRTRTARIDTEEEYMLAITEQKIFNEAKFR